MEWCFKCGISGSKALLFDAISEKGIVKICKKCSMEEDIPIVNKPGQKIKEEKPLAKSLPQDFSKKISDSTKRMYERLSKLSGVRIEKKENKTKEQDSSLRNIANKNFESQIRREDADVSDLISNFNWVIMRTRRQKHLTREQLAEKINEPESAIKMAEQGTLPKNHDLLIKKVEDYFGVRLSKNSPSTERKFEEEPKFDPAITKNLTISDLQEMKRKKEEKILGEKSLKKNSEDNSENEELSEEDINRLVWGDEEK